MDKYRRSRYGRPIRVSGDTAGKRRLRECFIEQKGICYLCDKTMHMGGTHHHPVFGFQRQPKGAHATLEHPFPISRGGNHSKENTRAACAECNHRKGPLTVEEYKLYLAEPDKEKRKAMLREALSKTFGYNTPKAKAIREAQELSKQGKQERYDKLKQAYENSKLQALAKTGVDDDDQASAVNPNDLCQPAGSE